MTINNDYWSPILPEQVSEYPFELPPSKEKLLKILLAQGGVRNTSKEAVQMLRYHFPDEFEHLDDLVNQHPDKVRSLKEHGWQAQKKRCDMTAVEEGNRSYEAYRKEVVDAVTNITLVLVAYLGFDPGAFSATGTPGWNSDIDTVYLAGENVPEEVQMIVKTLFDMIFFQKFERFPGFLFDTESYLNHAGAALNTASKIETPDGKSAFSRLEFTATTLQMLRQTGGKDSPKWQKFVRDLRIIICCNNQDSPLAQAFDSIIQAVEEFEDTIDKGVTEELARLKKSEKKDEMIGPSIDRQEAMMSYKTAPLIRLSKLIDDLKNQDNCPKEQQQLKLALLYMLRTSFFDEGYYAQGTFAKTCSNVGGQIHDRKIEGFRETLERARLEQRPIHQLMEEGHRFNFNVNKAARTTGEQHASAALENLAFYYGHYEHKLDSNENLDQLPKEQEALIATSKYSQRSIDSAKAIHDITKSQPGSLILESIYEGEKRMIQSVHQMLQQSCDLETVKRSRRISSITAEKLLLKEFEKIVDDKEKLEKIKEMIQDANDYIEKQRYEETITLDDLYIIMISKLAKFIPFPDLDYRGLPTNSKFPMISLIVKARCGCIPAIKDSLSGEDRVAMEKEGKGIQDIIQSSGDLTLTELGFTSFYEIKTFNENIQSIVLGTIARGFFSKSFAMPILENNSGIRSAPPSPMSTNLRSNFYKGEGTGPSRL